MRHLELIEFIQETPFLGTHLVSLEDRINELESLQGPGIEPDTRPIILAAKAQLWFARNPPDTITRLEGIATTLEELDQEEALLGVRLLQVRHLAREHRKEEARDHLRRILRQAGTYRSLSAAWRLAAASAGISDGRSLFHQALAHLPSPGHDEDRLVALLGLAHHAEQGSDLEQTRHRLDEALQICLTHSDTPNCALVSSLLGNLTLCMGRPKEALSHLQRAFALAAELQDSLSILSQGSILAGLLLSMSRHEEAQRIGDTMRDAALQRKNWLGYTDAQLLLSECALQLEGLHAAVQRLCKARLELIRLKGSPAAVSLLIARLAELRFEYGEERLDTLLRTNLD